MDRDTELVAEGDGEEDEFTTIRPESSETSKVSLKVSIVEQRDKTPPEEEDDKKNKKQKRMILNIAGTKYEVVKHVAKKMLGWKVINNPDSKVWDVYWTDCAVQSEHLKDMHLYQKINHFPGMYTLANKAQMAKNLKILKKAFPDYYRFFPDTWLLPAEKYDFLNQFKERKPKTFILKPNAGCQGRGIKLIQHPEQLVDTERYIAQKYILRPYLIDGLKFDFRVYVLLAGCNPLRIYLYKEGLGRFCTKPYQMPNKKNLKSNYMHLTNYSINKNSKDFVFNEDIGKADEGHKRTLTSVMKLLEGLGEDVKLLWKDIKKMIVKTICAGQPVLAHHYNTSQPLDHYNHMCFEILGFDFMVDHKLRPVLIEINHTPSFATPYPVDFEVKRNVIHDALVIMNVNQKTKKKLVLEMKQRIGERVLTGKRQKLSKEERQEIEKQCQEERQKHISKHLGGYEVCFPNIEFENEEPYEKFMEEAARQYIISTGGDPNKEKQEAIKKEVAFNSTVCVAKGEERKKAENEKENGTDQKKQNQGLLSPSKQQRNKFSQIESKVKTRNFSNRHIESEKGSKGGYEPQEGRSEQVRWEACNYATKYSETKQKSTYADDEEESDFDDSQNRPLPVNDEDGDEEQSNHSGDENAPKSRTRRVELNFSKIKKIGVFDLEVPSFSPPPVLIPKTTDMPTLKRQNTLLTPISQTPSQVVPPSSLTTTNSKFRITSSSKGRRKKDSVAPVKPQNYQESLNEINTLINNLKVTRNTKLIGEQSNGVSQNFTKGIRPSGVVMRRQPLVSNFNDDPKKKKVPIPAKKLEINLNL